MQRDRVRRQRVKELLESEALQSPEDYFHAAIVFQHGETLEDFWRAHELAMRGAELGHPSCRQLAAAAYDRWLVNQGKPQKFGTQVGSRDGGPIQLWDVDPTVTDEERAAWDLPPLAAVLQWVEERNREKEELRKQGLLPTPAKNEEQGPERFASLEVSGLRVDIIDFDERFVHPVPEQEKPAREELPAPESFPQGWKLYRVGEGYTATTADGQEVINWYKVPEPVLRYAWREREIPRLEAVQLGEQPAILISSSYPAFTQLFLQVGKACYLVGGKAPLKELLQLATSIP
jgi:hypothetical protein